MGWVDEDIPFFGNDDGRYEQKGGNLLVYPFFAGVHTHFASGNGIPSDPLVDIKGAGHLPDALRNVNPNEVAV